MNSRKPVEVSADSVALVKIRIVLYWTLRGVHFILMCLFIPLILFFYSLNILLQIIMYNVNPKHGESDEINEIWDRYT